MLGHLIASPPKSVHDRADTARAPRLNVAAIVVAYFINAISLRPPFVCGIGSAPD